MRNSTLNGLPQSSALGIELAESFEHSYFSIILHLVILGGAKRKFVNVLPWSQAFLPDVCDARERNAQSLGEPKRIG